MPFAKSAGAAMMQQNATATYSLTPENMPNMPQLSITPSPILSKPLLHHYSSMLPNVIPPMKDPQRDESIRAVANCVAAAKSFLAEMEAKGLGEIDRYVSMPFDHLTSDCHGVIHIGAHIGQEVDWYYSKVGSRVVHIECNPKLIPQLAANVTPFGHTCIQACLWNVAGQQREFFFTDCGTNDSQSASIVGNLTIACREKFNLQDTGSTLLTTTDWHTLCAQHPFLGDANYDFLVIDTQGAEYQILESIIQSSGKNPNLRGLKQFQRILLECSNIELYHGQKLQPEVEALLTAHGFVNVEKRYPDHDNVLYVNSNYSCASKTLV